MKNFLRQKGETADLAVQENKKFKDTDFFGIEMLECALTVVISNTIVKPKIKAENGCMLIRYKLQEMNVEQMHSIYEINRLNRLDVWVDAVRLSVKAEFNNMVGERCEIGIN